MKTVALTVLGLLILHSAVAGQEGPTDIHDAVRRGDLSGVRSLISSADSLLEARDFLGHTPLSLSAAYARWDIFRYLLDEGADVNIVTRTSVTPLHCASYYDRPEMVQLLFQRGGAASMEVGDVFGEYTPMLRAVQRGCGDVVTLLFERGADPEETTKEGWNALHLAAKCGHRHLYGLLIDSGVSLDALDEEGNAPMAYDFKRPRAVEIDSALYADYVGFYTWEGAPAGLGARILMEGGRMMLDDNSLNVLYPIAEDTFYCSQDPWKVQFYRDEAGVVDRVELHFLRQSVILEKA